eukprot:scaffold93047_cov31-Tisochrysis_lutea.AAC.3
MEASTQAISWSLMRVRASEDTFELTLLKVGCKGTCSGSDSPSIAYVCSALLCILFTCHNN